VISWTPSQLVTKGKEKILATANTLWKHGVENMVKLSLYNSMVGDFELVTDIYRESIIETYNDPSQGYVERGGALGFPPSKFITVI